MMNNNEIWVRFMSAALATQFSSVYSISENVEVAAQMADYALAEYMKRDQSEGVPYNTLEPIFKPEPEDESATS